MDIFFKPNPRCTSSSYVNVIAIIISNFSGIRVIEQLKYFINALNFFLGSSCFYLWISYNYQSKHRVIVTIFQQFWKKDSALHQVAL
jgi:hypothetical protein